MMMNHFTPFAIKITSKIEINIETEMKKKTKDKCVCNMMKSIVR